LHFEFEIQVLWDVMPNNSYILETLLHVMCAEYSTSFLILRHELYMNRHCFATARE